MREGYTLRPYQQRAVNFVNDSLLNRGTQNVPGEELTNSAIIVLPTGCHALGERLIMADGTIKAVEEIHVGDVLCGEDGSPRVVQYVHKGESDLYKIVPKRGDSFIVTGDHKLTLIDSKYKEHISEQEYLDIEVKEYLSMPDSERNRLKLIRSKGVNFTGANTSTSEPLLIDPYYVGNTLDKLQRSIPEKYKRGNKKTRQLLLAGVLDGDNCFYHPEEKCLCCEILSKSIAEDICFVARSIGIGTYFDNDIDNQIYHVYFYGDFTGIPCIVNPCVWQNDNNEKIRSRMDDFTVERLSKGKYIGFTVDGDNRYLLPDFTITHNCGKTICFSAIVENEVNNGGRVLILAHRNKLLEQAHDKLLSACDIDASYEGKDGGDNRVVICSIQSMSKDDRLARYTPDFFSLIIVDETHHIASPSYLKVRDYFNGAKLVGVTATPVRGDGYDTRRDFDIVGPEYTTQQAIDDGFLTPPHVKKIPLKIDISDVHMQRGDYSAGEIANVLDKYLIKIAKKTAEVASDKKTVVFVPLVSTAQKMAEMYRNIGLRAEYVSGERKDSDEVLEKFEQGEYDVVVNSMLLTEGWDCPSVDCVINLRPTRSQSLYTQIIGRGLRLSPGKSCALILDFLWQDTGRGQLSVEEVLCPPADEFEKRAMERLLENGDEYSLSELKERAKENATNEREIALQEAIQRANLEKELKLQADKAKAVLFSALEEYAMRVSREKGMSPLDVYGVIRRGQKKNVMVKYHCMSGDIVAIKIEDKAMESMGLSNFYIGNGEWQQKIPTLGQVKFATQLGIPQEYLVCSGQVSEILTVLDNRSRRHLGSYKQLRILTNAGQQDVGELSAGECARRMKNIFSGRRNRNGSSKNSRNQQEPQSNFVNDNDGREM